MSQSRASKLREQIQSGRVSVESAAGQDATSFRNEHFNKVTRDNLGNVKQQASDAGLNKSIMLNKVNTAGSDLRNKYQDITSENNVQYNAVKHANELLNAGLNQRADKYEEDRIGQGNVVGKNLAIGGLNKAERSIKNLEGDIKPLKLTSK
jgi:hypothetical protein